MHAIVVIIRASFELMHVEIGAQIGTCAAVEISSSNVHSIFCRTCILYFTSCLPTN
jgi:hypothetical protein